MQILLLLLAIAVVAIAVLATTFIVGMRRKTPFVLNAVRRAGRAFKPVVLKTAGEAGSPNTVVEHVGRSSGKPYETPVVATPTPDGFAIALPYGQNTDWLKNVLAAGTATVRFDGSSYQVDAPTVVDLAGVNDKFAAKEQRAHKQFNVREALTVHTVAVSA